MNSPQASLISTEPFPLHATLKMASTASYLSFSHGDAVVPELHLHNTMDRPLLNLQLVLQMAPAFAPPCVIHIERLEPGERRCLTSQEVLLRPDCLVPLDESTRAVLSLDVTIQNPALTAQALAQGETMILPYEQWPGITGKPDTERAHWLASFCQPNASSVEKVRREAAAILMLEPSTPSSGEQNITVAFALDLARALYQALLKLNLHYSIPAASFASGQKIRLPDRVIESGLGTCLDLAVLLASCFEQSGLAPVLFLSSTHAWVGCWLGTPSSKEPVLTDMQFLRKCTDLGEMVVLEATLLTKGSTADFEMATRVGRANLDNESFELAVDVAAARAHGVLPLPSRLALQPELAEVAPTVAATVQPLPAPELHPTESPIPMEAIGLPERLSHWQAQLLDLSKANQLLHCRPSGTAALIAPIVPLAELDKAMALKAPEHAGLMRLVPSLARGAAPPNHMIAWSGTELPLLTPTQGLTSINMQLQTMAEAARESEHEAGFNPLFLCLGMLEWKDESKLSDGQALALSRAPIWLIPVQLQRSAHQHGSEWSLKRRAEDALFNPALKELMRQRFDMALPAMAPNSDLPQVLQALRRAVGARVGWEVHDQAVLGLFSFAKDVLWQDLVQRTEHLRDNPVVAHLLDHPGKSMPCRDFPIESDLMQSAREMVSALSADASQRAVLTAVDRGHNLVVQGPPGTGKSQTVANLIARAVSHGKTVLFVSDKREALDVVHRRLDGIGLAPSCLELHSNKASTHDILNQLSTALETAQEERGLTDTETAINAALSSAGSDLAEHAAHLDGVMKAMQTPSPGGFTLHEALSATLEAKLADALPVVAMPWPRPDTHDADSLQALRHLVREIGALAQDLPDHGRTMHLHPLRALGMKDSSALIDSDSMRQSANRTEVALLEFEKQANGWLQNLGMANVRVSALSSMQLNALCELTGTVQGATGQAREILPHALDRQAAAVLHTMQRHNLRRLKMRQALPCVFSDSVMGLAAHKLLAQWQAIENSWGLWRWWLSQKLLRQLSSHRRGSLVPSLDDVARLVASLPTIQYDQSAMDEQRILLPWSSTAKVITHGLDDGPALAQEEQAGTSDAALTWLNQMQHASEQFFTAMQGVGLPDNWKTSLTNWVMRLGDDPSSAHAELAPGIEAWKQARAELALLSDDVSTLTLGDALAKCATWRSSTHLCLAWHRWQQLRAQAIAAGLGGLISAVDEGRVQVQDAEPVFETSFKIWWANGILNAVTFRTRNDPAQVLRGFKGALHERQITALARSVLTGQAAAAAAACQRALGAANTAIRTEFPDAELGALRRELARHRGHRPLRQILQTMPTLLYRLKPCWLMSPISIAQYLGNGHPAFDLIIFDEASQVPVSEAVAAISRAKQVVIFGDPKQLPPTRFFERAQPQAQDSDDQINTADMDSILDECIAIGMPSLSLNVHYRSAHESLIAFSNQHFYKGRLITCPEPNTHDNAVQWVPVAGTYERGASRTNLAEAQAIAQAVQEHCTRVDVSVPSLGVVCFSQPQQHLIETLVSQRRRVCTELDSTLSAMESAGEPFFVRNLESIQGDERDVIYFSMTYGPDAQGKMSNNFGPINLAGGERRLNVALTRARQGMRVYASMRASDLAEGQGTQGVQTLRAFLDWVERGCPVKPQQTTTPERTLDRFDASVKQALQSLGWQVHSRVGRCSQRVDLAVVDPQHPNRYLAGLLCDGSAHAAISDASDREVLRLERLRVMGWHVKRLWLLDWVNDFSSQVEMLDAQLRALSTAPTTADQDAPRPASPVETAGLT